MLDRVLIKLLQGEFICETTDPEGFRWLSRGDSIDEVNSFLSRVNRTLSITDNSQAFFASWKKIGQEERVEVKRTFTQIKQVIRPLMHFISLCMETQKRDVIPAPGDTIEYSIFMKTISDSQHLSEMLREFSVISKDFSVTESSIRSMLDKVIQQMEKQGYLVLVSKENSIYRFTGKLDYFYQTNEFLIENEGIDVRMVDEDIKDDNETKSLF